MPVKIEADISNGMPSFEMVGFLASEVKEAKERIRIALKNCQIELPMRRITVNFTPADIRKSGSSFDLAITTALLSAMGVIPKQFTENTLFLGEVGLNGELLPVKGILSASIMAKELGIEKIVVPWQNKEEAALIQSEVKVIPVTSVDEFIEISQNKELSNFYYLGKNQNVETRYKEDFSDIYGQHLAKRACEIAVSGRHNILMIGPPGSGKTMLAKRIPTIFPELEFDEILEVSKIYNLYQNNESNKSLIYTRPFRVPHHSITSRGLCGGGKIPVPGEISLAHKGVLFLDEFPEFAKNVIDTLRQPMEDGCIQIDRVGGRYCFPCDFMAVAAMNPCKCGYFPDGNRCTCTLPSVHSYINRISQPILDRFDMTVETTEVAYTHLEGKVKEESSEEIRKRVVETQQIQRTRFKEYGYRYNSQMSSTDVNKFCVLDEASKKYLESVRKEAQLSVRAYFKILKVARTIADMDKREHIQVSHLMEAFAYRCLDKKYWKPI